MSRRGGSPVLVGRATEMATLGDAFAAVRQGGPSAMLIGGEAGVGKTRLISEFAAEARLSGARVLTGGCLELGADGLPFGPFTAMLRDLVRETGADEIIALLPGSGRATRELARLLPELASAGGAAPAPLPAQAEPSPGEARARLFEEILTLFERLAADRPLVLAIEDAHWADRSSRDLIAFLIGYQRTLRNVLILVTFRSDELHRTHPLRPLLAELARIDWVERTELPRLTRGQAEELAAAVLGRSPERALADSLYERAEGNPLFTEELLAAPEGCDMIPGSLADLLQHAVRRMPEETQEVLRVASAGSGAISHQLLATITGLGDDGLTSAIRPAVTGNVLVTTADGYTFRHALIREAVHEDLLPGEHSRVHTRFALAIEADPGLVGDGRADIERAHHWYSAHNTTGALTSAWQACAQACRSVAHAERLMLLERVLMLWDQVPDAATRIGVDHVRVLEEAADVAQSAGEHQRGLMFTESALAELDETVDPVRVALLLGQRYTFQHDLGLAGTQEEMERALALVPLSLSRPARIKLLIIACQFGCHTGALPFRGWAQEALQLARETGDREAEAQALTAMAMIASGPLGVAEPDSETFRLLGQARQIAEQAGAYQPVIKIVVYESHLLCGAGEYERAAEVARQGIAHAERQGLARTRGAFLSINVAEPLQYLGRWDEAAEVAERALDLAPPSLTRIGLWLVPGAIALARGDLAGAARRAAASRAVQAGVRYDDQHALPQADLDIQLTLLTEGPAAATALAAALLERYDLAGSSPRYVWPVLVAAARAAREARDARDADPEAAAALLQRVRTLAEKTEVVGPVQRAYQLSYAAVDPAPGADPVAAADAAAQAWEAMKQPYPTALALYRAAEAALSVPGAGGRAAAAIRLRRAAPIAERLGARPLAERIADLARRAGETASAAASGSAGGGQLGLTGREFEVLRLVAAGQSNREIATALFISPKTASVHVSNILAKLGAATRTEAAAKAHALGVFNAARP